MSTRILAVVLSVGVALVFGVAAAALSERITLCGGIVVAVLAAVANSAIEMGTVPELNGPVATSSQPDPVLTPHQTADENRAVSAVVSSIQASEATTATLDLARFRQSPQAAQALQCPRCGRFDLIRTDATPTYACRTCNYNWQHHVGGAWPRTVGHPAAATIDLGADSVPRPIQPSEE